MPPLSSHLASIYGTHHILCEVKKKKKNMKYALTQKLSDTVHVLEERLLADTCLHNSAILWDVAGMKGNTREVLDLLADSDLSVETKLSLQQFFSI